MISPTVFARRCLCYLMSDMPQAALGDAMQAQVVNPEWPTACYLQVAALKSLGMENDAQEILKDGTSLEGKKHRNWKLCIGFPFLFPLFIFSLYLNLSIPSQAFEFFRYQRINCDKLCWSWCIFLFILTYRSSYTLAEVVYTNYLYWISDDIWYQLRVWHQINSPQVSWAISSYFVPHIKKGEKNNKALSCFSFTVRKHCYHCYHDSCSKQVPPSLYRQDKSSSKRTPKSQKLQNSEVRLNKLHFELIIKFYYKIVSLQILNLPQIVS